MKALVTGAGGFLGQYVVEQLLERGWEVRALGRGRYPALERLGVELAQVDLRDRESTIAVCQGIDVVHHVAAIAGIWGPREDFERINVGGTEHILAGCERYGVPRLVFTSSPSVTFDGRAQCGIDETAPYPRRWLCDYPRTKALAEQKVLAAHGRGGLATCALRPHLIWGPRDTNLIPRLLERARSGQLRRVGDGQNLVDMIYVENAALAHVQAAEALLPGGAAGGKTYFLSQGTPVNCWQWIDEILALADLPRLRRAIPLPVAYAVGGMLEAAHRLLGRQTEPRMTRFLALQLGKSHFFDIGRARADFGYEPKVSTEEGMRRLAAWLRGRKSAPE